MFCHTKDFVVEVPKTMPQVLGVRVIGVGSGASGPL